MIIDVEIAKKDVVIETDFSMTSETLPVKVEAQQYYSTGTKKHDELSNRELDNQHPISAITGLKEELDNKLQSSKLVAITNREIDAICV